MTDTSQTDLASRIVQACRPFIPECAVQEFTDAVRGATKSTPSVDSGRLAIVQGHLTSTQNLLEQVRGELAHLQVDHGRLLKSVADVRDRFHSDFLSRNAAAALLGRLAQDNIPITVADDLYTALGLLREIKRMPEGVVNHSLLRRFRALLQRYPAKQAA